MAENKLKKLFEKKSNKFLASEDLSSLGNKVESSEYVKQFSDESERFIPPVDFDDPKNFVKFGSAKNTITMRLSEFMTLTRMMVLVQRN